MLRVGAKGAEVKAVQERLTALGYWNGKADGSFGSLTRQAVFALQKAAGLGRDGVEDGGDRPVGRLAGHEVEPGFYGSIDVPVAGHAIRPWLWTGAGSPWTAARSALVA